MDGKSRFLRISVVITILVILTGVGIAYAWNPLPVVSDPWVRMPGTQPGDGVSLESPNRCLNCHEGYNSAVEPGFNWKGSMMAQSARDFVFWSAMTVAAQDAIWATGTPNATDICLRCHFPQGWLEGRSDPTNASLMAGADYDGVQCDFCHRMYDPFFETTYLGTREGDDWLGYWDETNTSGTPSQPAADSTYQEDSTLAAALTLFNGSPFFVDNLPHSATYTENTSGQYFVSPNGAKRASFADAAARHQMFYSRYHKSKYFCGTCHDVSNPVLANLGQDGSQPLTTESQSAASYFHVERTFSEFMLSAYGAQDGAAGIGPFDPDTYTTSLANNYISKCQDCHMRDVVGAGANKNGAPVRPDDSQEHPQSGQPLHDLTGGNVWVSYVLASAIPGSPNYDALNDQLLNQGPAVLTLDLGEGLGVDPAALIAGSQRAGQQLELAASIQNLSYDASTGLLSFRIQNQTGHKLPSGFPEGRRIFVNVRAYAGGSLIWEVNPYDAAAGTLKGFPSAQALGQAEEYREELVFEMHPSSGLTGEDETLHFVLADDRYKDNRIPPQGFDLAASYDRLAQPRWGGQNAPDYFTTEEYVGGYDDIGFTILSGADAIEVNLYYQTTSREYITFLQDEINGTANSLPASAYIAQNDPFFSQLKGWGDAIWDLWWHNKDLPGAAPYLMTQASFGSTGSCQAPVPTLLSANAGNKEVLLTWSDEHSQAPAVSGYGLYYDQAGKSQWFADAGLTTSFLDTNLTNGQQYCYMVTTQTASCESGFSNIICATPATQVSILVETNGLVSGMYQGQGGNKTFVPGDLFTAGDEVVLQVFVLDANTGQPVSNAVVEVTLSGPENNVLTSSPSGANGFVEIKWPTKAPKGNKPGTAPGSYSVAISNVSGSGITWNGVVETIQFTLQP